MQFAEYKETKVFLVSEKGEIQAEKISFLLFNLSSMVAIITKV